MTIQFTKMHGLGNDFVIIDGVRQSVHISPELVRTMSDRHFGIGFDQLLLIEPAKRANVDFEYRIFNADGGEVGQCGNGARCVGRFLLESGLAQGHKKKFILGTKQGVIEVHVQPDQEIMVNMGVPSFEPDKVPFQVATKAASYPLEVDNLTPDIGVVNVGNPHAVLVVEDVHTAPVKIFGEKIAHHPRFPEGVNVGFAQHVNPGQIWLRVYERGAGETLACGSGACAAVVVGRMQGLLDENVEVNLLGGKLMIRWPGEGQPVWMTGPAQTVFRGEWISPPLKKGG